MIPNLSAEELRMLFSSNLNKLMSVNDKKTADVARDLKVPYTTVAGWVHGERMPRMDKIEALARYFGVSRADLIEEHVPQPDGLLDTSPDTIKKAPVDITEDDFSYAMYNEGKTLTPEKKQALLQMAKLFNEDLKKEEEKE